MKTETISAALELHEKLIPYYGRHYAFRGVKNQSYTLTPKIGRNITDPLELVVATERKMLSEFRKIAPQYITIASTDDWDLLALAQHHGLPTRLLDWSYNPLVAAFFAVQEKDDSDAAIYVMDLRSIAADNSVSVSPHDIKDVTIYHPAHLSRRINAQEGIFTAHPDPRAPLETGVVVKLVIKRFIKRNIKEHLFYYGVHERSIFPDIDGVCRLLQWQYSDQY